MNTRKKILFKRDGEVVAEDTRDLQLTDIEKMKWLVAEELECGYDDIEVETEVTYIEQELSEYDVTCTGLVNFKDPYFKTITGVTCNGDINDLLDMITKSFLTNYLELS